ncbi:MAG: C4-type zinc ribbon domain-containing protein [Candidatus Firestonebacteria bacterium]
MLKNELELLLKLQEMDTRIDELEGKKTEIPQILDEQKLNIKDKQDKEIIIKKENEELQKSKKMIELELGSKNSEMIKLQSQLYSVKTNKEYSAVQQEMAYLKENVSKIEEDIISKMLNEDEVKKKVNVLQDEIKEEEDKLRKIEEKCNKEIQEIDQQMNELKLHKEEIVKKIETNELLNTYNNIRQNLGGVGIVKVVNNSCNGCFINLRAQVIIEIKKYESLIFCENCGRILYI